MTDEKRIAAFTKEIKHLISDKCEIRIIGGCIYAFDGELETLRCLKLYRACKDARAGFSENLNCFYFSLEINF